MQLSNVMRRLAGTGTSVEFRAYDGSRCGPPDAAVRLDIRNPRALTYLVTSSGELGLARAYVSGDLGIEGDLYDALRALANNQIGQLSWPERWEVLRSVGVKTLRPVAPPPEEVRVRRWRPRSKATDKKAISHHYDVSNRFYEWVLGPSMAYTCAVFPRPDATLEEAQAEKFDLVCRKLALRPGMRLLDVGCGWGGMVLHATRHYGVRALGVTLSRQQAEWAQKAIADAGLSDHAEVRWGDYRDVAETGFDAVSSIGLTEHIGLRQLPAYFRFLHTKLRPQGRLLNHCIMRPTTRERARAGAFISRYVFPNGELEGLGTIVAAMQDNGFEVRHEENLREHYAKTLAAWCANLDAHWDEAVREVGVGTARVWLLYMAGSRLGFERNSIQLHQVLGVKTVDGQAAFPLRPDW
ncbi:MAG TPA: class I SAM-dependent methyltransferase [Mycobacteriales bacterium]|nr:class I SAM-dependent methyltransferase [Mycobacteriales bacterium]